MKQIKKFIKLTNLAQKIMNSEADWETKFDLIFSDMIITKIRKIDISIDWYDPDTSYEADVKAYVYALIEKATELAKILDVE
jgi:maltooligosyltrehalose synthase